MQDPNPLPWGAQDRFQAHYIVRKKVDDPLSHSARVVQTTPLEDLFGNESSSKWATLAFGG